VSRKKDNLVLFEVLSNGHSSMRVPDYVYKSRQQELDKQKEAAGKELTEATPVEEPTSEPEAEAPVDAVVEAPAETPPAEDTPLLTDALGVDSAPDEAEESADETDAPEGQEPADVPPTLPEASLSSGHAQVRSTLPSWARPRDEAQQKSGNYITPTVHRRVVEVHGDRLHLSVNVVVAMLLLGAVLVLWVGAFVAGRMTAPAVVAPNADPSPVEKMNPSPGGNPAIQGRVLGTLDVAAEATDGQYDPSRYYLRIQPLVGQTAADRKGADEIVAYCVGQSIPAEVFKTSKGFWIVSRMGFRSPTSKEARSYASKVHTAGKAYQQRTNGSVSFSQETEGRPSPKYISGKKIRRPK
jgi:hypothetical protein